MKRLLEKMISIGVTEDDDADLIIWKRVATGGVWGACLSTLTFALVFWLNGAKYTATVASTYAILSALMLVLFARNKRFGWFRIAMLGLLAIVPGINTILMGGVLESGILLIWTMWMPIAALATGAERDALKYAVLSVAAIAIFGIIVQFTPSFDEPPRILSEIIGVMNILGVGIFLFGMMRSFVAQRDTSRDLLAQEQALTMELLLNVLPESIARRLQDGETMIADRFDETSVLFADMVGFTELSEQLEAGEVVKLLNELFTRFDRLAEARGVEKIRTIGDAYMAVAGAPIPCKDHAPLVIDLALAMAKELAAFRDEFQVDCDFRIGINSGPVIGAIIGKSKFHYDVWGETVNLASRMESHGLPGRIQMTQTTYRLLEGNVSCEARGPIEVKGTGLMKTWLVI